MRRAARAAIFGVVAALSPGCAGDAPRYHYPQIADPARPATLPGIPLTGFSPGFVDTLVRVAGAPRRLEVLPLPGNMIGAYSPKHDFIIIDTRTARWMPRHRPDSLATWLTRISPDWVLAHEFGHRFDARRGHLPSRQWMRGSYAVRATSDYANEDAGERWAEAFANATDFLRYAASEREHAAVLRSLAARETFIPGTADVVAFLLEHRVYARHPLNRRAFARR